AAARSCTMTGTVSRCASSYPAATRPVTSNSSASRRSGTSRATSPGMTCTPSPSTTLRNETPSRPAAGRTVTDRVPSAARPTVTWSPVMSVTVADDGPGAALPGPVPPPGPLPPAPCSGGRPADHAGRPVPSATAPASVAATAPVLARIRCLLREDAGRLCTAVTRADARRARIVGRSAHEQPRRRLAQPARVRVARVVVHLRGGSLLHDQAVVHHGHV